MKPSEVPCYAAETRPGDLVIFRENTLHSSFGGSPGRYQNAINFMENPKTEEQVAYVRGLYEGWKFGLRPAESYVRSDRPRIRGMVSRLVEWGFDTSAADGCSGGLSCLPKSRKSNMRLSGSRVFKGLFSPAAASVIREEFEVGLAAERGRLGTPELPTYFYALGPRPRLWRRYPRTPGSSRPRSMWGEDVVAIGSAGQRFTKPNTYWHPDLPRRYFGDEGQPLAGRQVRLLSEVAGR